jgi:hypothetical protein
MVCAENEALPSAYELAAYSDAELDRYLEENGRSAFYFHYSSIVALLILSPEWLALEKEVIYPTFCFRD